MPGQNFHFVKRTSEAVFAVVMGALFLGSPAQAGETEVTGRYVNNKSENVFLMVGDEKGHVVGSFTATGMSIYPDEGEVPRFTSGNFDFTDGVGPMWGHTTVVYNDKSTLTVNWEGEAKRNEKKEFYSEGTLTCVGGTGRLEGAKCEGTWGSTKYLSNGMVLGGFKYKLTLPD
jgi:hypothetical protein